MHKTKKKSKTAKLPKPIKVKNEKSDEDRLPQSMAHYIDDRLEMVKQIFSTLKPKTIVNLAPEFLKTKALEEIEEACLNELLCISTKRLKSIITNSKCPTDTESSDSDSDVEKHEEHISLEEISSDSEIEGSNSKKVKKKKNLKAADETEAAKKDAPKTDTAEDGQISVLELLELQARARAIRSQLALEPVTKIEVDSDEEKRKKVEDKDKTKYIKKDDKTNKNERKRHSSDIEPKDSAKMSRSNGSTENLSSKAHEETANEKRATKKVNLMRIYRTSINTENREEVPENHDTENPNKDNEKSNDNKERTSDKAVKEKNKNKDLLITDIKKEKSSRSLSPDVIPIVAEPETLLITDSSDDEKQAEKKEAKKTTNEKPTTDASEPQHKERKTSETTKNEIDKTKEKTFEPTPAEEPQENTATNATNIESFNENTQDSQFKISDKEDTQDTKTHNKYGKKSSAHKEKSSKTHDSERKSNSETNSANHSDDDQNEDVISLGGDLENEMNEQLENEVNHMQSPYNKKNTEESSQDNNKSQDESQQEDVILLVSSDDERVSDNQSWHSRYMKSSKVNKVLAASRLGKRVRDNIKKFIYIKKETSHEISEAEKEKSTPVFTSKHEDGSVEQYKELLEMRQRKTS